MMIQSMRFANIYEDLLRLVRSQAVTETNQRTGVKIKALRGAYAFKIDLSHGLPIAGDRKIFPHVAAAENAWQILGTDDTKFISKHWKIWDKFADDNGRVEAAYGHRWKTHFGRDQLRSALSALKSDPSNRQVFISAWDPGFDGLGDPGQPPNIPCHTGFALNIVAKQLHCSVFMRSSDVYVGLPYDVMTYAYLMDAISTTLGKGLGTLSFMLAHAHCYEPQWQDMEASLYIKEAKHWHEPQLQFPMWTVHEIHDDPEGYVKFVKRQWQRTEDRPKWDPKPEVVV